jgi:transglutaminase-like putative cysteine protease
MGCAGRTLIFAAALLAPGLSSAADQHNRPVVHERIPADPSEDLALHVALDGDLPAAIRTPGGVVGAPDPLRPPSPGEMTYGAAVAHDAFVPDTDTKRPEVSDYDDPFMPSTAPFKRLEAFDAVRSDYRLEVRDDRLVRLTTQTGAPPGPEEDPFYGDLVVEVPPEGMVRIPSVGPGARIVRARLGIGASDVPFRIMRDGADNWFLLPAKAASAHAGVVRARLVMELAIMRAAFGGKLGDPSWTDLALVAPLPDNVARDAAEVRAAIGVSRAMRPREAIAKLVDYFRGFTDSADPPRDRGSVYLDLSLTKKGVCRHRAFAFLVTAQSLGIPTRLAENEAHAWVEVHDGTRWLRIDLGGAGRMETRTSNRLASRDAYEGPREAFPWPLSSERGADMIARAGAAGAARSSPRSASPATDPADPSAPAPAAQDSERDDGDRRAPSTVAVTVTDAAVHRGLPVHVRGTVRAGDEPCPHVPVELWLREPKEAHEDEVTRKRFAVGTLATGDDGAFAGIVVPVGVPLGDYDLIAETPGDSRCGRGRN